MDPRLPHSISMRANVRGRYGHQLLYFVDCYIFMMFNAHTNDIPNFNSDVYYYQGLKYEMAPYYMSAIHIMPGVTILYMNMLSLHLIT